MTTAEIIKGLDAIDDDPAIRPLTIAADAKRRQLVSRVERAESDLDRAKSQLSTFEQACETFTTDPGERSEG